MTISSKTLQKWRLDALISDHRDILESIESISMRNKLLLILTGQRAEILRLTQELLDINLLNRFKESK